VNVSAAILAGGHATRFGGRDKGALVVDGRTIRDRQLEMLASLTNDVMVVGTPAGGAQAGCSPSREQDQPTAAMMLGEPPMARRREETNHVRVLPDIVPGCGPLGGLHAALTAARGDALLLVACDMPFVTAAFAGHLLSLAEEAAIVVPKTERGYHPLCAVYTRACLETVATRLADRRLRLRELVEDMPTRVVTGEEIERFGDRHRLLANVNTPAEYAGIEIVQVTKL
jgi:molybdopterin-guanine dinucleotide biosynthesis protein A